MYLFNLHRGETERRALGAPLKCFSAALWGRWPAEPPPPTPRALSLCGLKCSQLFVLGHLGTQKDKEKRVSAGDLLGSVERSGGGGAAGMGESVARNWWIDVWCKALVFSRWEASGPGILRVKKSQRRGGHSPA